MKKANNFWHVSILLVISCLISSSVALADGGYVWVETFLGQAKSGGQQAIVLYFDDRETLVLQTDYEGELADFSWLIPAPSPVTANDVCEADSDVFSWMDELTAPSFYLVKASGGGCSCGGGAGDGAGPESGYTDQDHVEVIETILTETYEVNVLAASEAQDLVDWLDQNSYAYPTGAEAVFADYILRGWYFLAVRIRPSNPGAEVQQSLAPLQISFETGEPVYPLMISSLSSDPETEILIHLLSDHRYRTSNVSCEEVDYQHTGEPNGYKSNYRQWMKGQVEDWYGKVYFVEYAGWLPYYDCLTVNNYLEGDPINCDDDVFVTRFRSYFSPDLFMDDIYFEQDPYDDSFEVMVEIWARSPGSSSRYLASLLFLTVAFVIRKKTSSNSGRHFARFGLLMALWILIA